MVDLVSCRYHVYHFLFLCGRLCLFFVQPDENRRQCIEFCGRCKHFADDALANLSNILAVAWPCCRSFNFQANVPAQSLERCYANRWTRYSVSSQMVCACTFGTGVLYLWIVMVAA